MTDGPKGGSACPYLPGQNPSYTWYTKKQRERTTPHIFFPGIPNHWSNGSHQSIMEAINQSLINRAQRPHCSDTLPPKHNATMAMALLHLALVACSSPCSPGDEPCKHSLWIQTQNYAMQKPIHLLLLLLHNFLQRGVGACHILPFGRSPIISILFVRWWMIGRGLVLPVCHVCKFWSPIRACGREILVLPWCSYCNRLLLPVSPLMHKNRAMRFGSRHYW